MTSFTGRGITAFRAFSIAAALELYAKHKIKATKQHTPKAMMAAAEQITGLSFKPRAYLEAASALRRFAEVKKVLALATGEIEA